jgi:hypothetical protein
LKRPVQRRQARQLDDVFVFGYSWQGAANPDFSPHYGKKPLFMA